MTGRPRGRMLMGVDLLEAPVVIKDSRRLAEFERSEIERCPPDFDRNLAIVEALWQEARDVSSSAIRADIASIEVDIRWARAINHVR